MKNFSISILLGVICLISNAQSLYKLPFPIGTTYTCTQGNNGNVSHFNKDQYAFDFGVPLNSPVCAMRAGVVTAVEESFANGSCPYSSSGCTAHCVNTSCVYCGNNVNRVVVQHSDGTKAQYIHLAPNGVNVNVGDNVTQGQIIAYSGNSGCSTAAHLHVMVMNEPNCSNNWYCQSIPFSFCDFPTNGGVPVTGSSCTSSTCNSCPQPSNDYCSTPTPLTPSATCTYIQGSTCNATPPTNSLATTCSTNSPPDDDVWYQFTATSTSHTITLQAITSTFDGVIELMSGTCPSSLSNVACANSFGVGSTETLTATGLTIGNIYLIRIFSNGNGIANTGDFNICVTTSSTCNPVSVTTQPTNQSATVGGTATLSVVAGGTAPFTYQWYKNGVAISGATNASYQTPTLSASDNGNTYYCHITNCSGSNSINTNTVVLTVTSTCTGASIATQPSNQSTTVGNTVTFSIVAGGTAPFTYQWYKNGMLISGATNYFYTTPSLTLSDNGNTYYCYVSNCSGSNNSTSSTATLTVTNTCNSVSIATQPTNQSATVGGTATFSVTANGTAPFTYQWYKNGVAISGATSNSYTTTTLSISDNGNYYYCVVTNCSGSYSSTSNNATLTVVSSCTAVSITSQTSTQYTTVGGTVTFVVNVSGTAPFTYQWYKNGTLISGATNSSYTTPALTLGDDGNHYYCVITNCSGANSITSANAWVYVSVANTCSNCPCWNWAKSSTGTIATIGNIAIDANQNSYVTGSYSSATITFGSTTLTNNGGNDVFLVKYDSLGNVVWVKGAGGSGNDVGYGVAVDNNNNVYLTGNFGSSSITFGSTTLTNTGFYIVKYNSGGVVQWAKDATARVFSHNGGNCIATDASGNVCVTGTYNGGSFNEIFVEKYNSAGTVLWTKNSTNSNGYGYAGGIATDINGNVYITGSCSANTNFNGSVWGIAGFYMVKFNSSGTPQWIVGPQGSGGGVGVGITVDLNGEVYMTGYFTGSSITCGGNVASNANAGSTDVLLVKYGNPSSVWSVGGTSYDEGYNITSDASGNIFVTGMFQSSSINFPLSNTISNIGTSTTDYDAFVVKYTAGFFGNNSSWAKAVNGGQTRAYGIAVTPQGNNIFMNGDFNTNAIFNTDTLIATSGYNIFTSKLSFSGTGQPTSISGNTSVCAGSTQTYSISPVSGATSYVWQATNGTVSGTGTSVSVTWNNISTGTIQVASQNSCGLSAYQTLNVTMNGAPAQPSSISGNSSPCQNSTQTYSISAVSGATSYVWQATNGTVTGSGTSISVAWNGNSTGVVQVAAVNSCGQSAFKVLNVTLASPPDQPTLISGNTNPCASSFEAYSISPISGATGYNWLCTNGTVTGSGTSVTVSWNSGTSGTLQVASQNSCGLSSYQTLNVTLNNPPNQPSAITGVLAPCAGSANSYSISPVANATSYSWTLPNGWQGNSSAININAIASSTSGSISVSALNTCGSSAAQNLSVNPIILPNITVNSPTICIGQTAILVANGGTNYSWSSGLIVNGDTASSSPITTTNYSVTGTLNGCSNIAYATVTVTVPTSATINGLPSAICFNSSPMTISGTPTGGIFSGNGVNGTTFEPTNAHLGSNIITYSYVSNGCNATTSQIIQVDTLITPSISAVNPTTFCIGDSVTIIGNYYNGVWSNASNSSAITVYSSGDYYLTNSNTCGSISSNHIFVTVNQLPSIPTIQVNGNSLACNTSSGVSYQWNLNGIPLSNDTLQFLTATTSGYYTITIRENLTGCSSTSTPTYVLITGLEQNLSYNSWRIFPNPTNDILNIIGSDLTNSNYTISLTNVLGQLLSQNVITVTDNKLERQVEVKQLSSGIYFLTIGSPNSSQVYKINKL